MHITVEHIGLPSHNPAALKDWYVNILGAKMIYTDGQPPVYFVRLPGATFEIYPSSRSSTDTSDNKLAGFRHMALRVDSLAAARAELEKHGVIFHEPPRGATGGGNVHFFKDPEGNLLHLVERPHDAAYLKAAG